MATETEALVIGGGSTGCGIVRDLALRGVDTTLVERGNLTHGRRAGCTGYSTAGSLRGLRPGERRRVLTTEAVCWLRGEDAADPVRMTTHLHSGGNSFPERDVSTVMSADTASFTLAAAQIEPVYHDKEGTLDKTCRWIEQAGNEGADLVVFPETYFPGYPYWRGSVSIPRWTDLMVDLQKNSLHVDDDAVDVLGEAIAEANLHVVLGANEVSDRPGSETLYNSLFYFDRSGELVGRHRKLMPTHEERAIWGRGDPGSLRTYDTDIGTLGGLICYENHMTLSKAALTAKGEEIHAAVWPGFWEQHGHPGDKSRAEDAAAMDTCDIYPAVREYAFETQSFVASCSAYMSDDIPEEFGEDELGFNVAAGGSMLVNPAGVVKAGPAVGEETLLTAEFSRDERRATKAYFDAMGHYSRWDAVNLEVSDERHEPIRAHDHDSVGSVRADRALSAAEVQAIADEQDVSIETVEAVLNAVRGQ